MIEFFPHHHNVIRTVRSYDKRNIVFVEKCGHTAKTPEERRRGYVLRLTVSWW